MQNYLESIGLASDLFILLLVFLAVGLAVGAVAWFFLAREDVEKRLSKLNPEDIAARQELEKKLDYIDHSLNEPEQY